jgi:hypothetical protein
LSLIIADTLGGIAFQAPDPCVPRELPVTATSITLPAGTLQNNRSYRGSLTFSRSFYWNTNSIPEMAGFGSLTKQTEFTLKTGTGGGTGPDPARFTGYRLLPNGNPELNLTGTALRTYTIERSPTLVAPAWQNVGTVLMNAAGQGRFEDTQTGKTFPLFYRAVGN